MDALEGRRLLDATALLDDVYENNDTPRQALLAEPGSNSPNLGGVDSDMEIRRLRLSDRADWFRFRLNATGGVGDAISIAFKNRQGNLDLALFNARGKVQLDSSATNRATESISLDGLSPGWYMARVTGRDGATNPGYRLSISAPSAESPLPGDDIAGPQPEANDTFDLVDAAPAAANGSPNLGTVTGAFTLANQTLDDTYDIFRFTIDSAAGAAAAVSILSATPFNLSLFNAQRQSIGFAAGYMGQSSLSLANLAPGTYYVQVTHYVLGLDGAFDYALAFDLDSAATS